MKTSVQAITDFMKRLFLSGFLALTLAPFVHGQPTGSFINNGTIITNIPPPIDATNFINNGIFEIALNAVATNKVGAFGTISLLNVFPALDFSDVLNYTNRGTMSCDTGFIFNTQPSGTGTPHRAALFGNSNLGQISAGSASSPIISTAVFFFGSLPQLTISATNVVSSGVLDVGVDGLLTVDGETLNLSHGLLNIEGLSTFGSLFTGGLFFGASFNIGIFPNYWGDGLETNAIPASSFVLSNAFSSFHPVTNTLFQAGAISVAPRNAQGFANVNVIDVSNITTQVVIVGNANTNVAIDCRFDFAGDFAVPIIQWASTTTNSFGVVTSNTLYLADGFGAFTNLQVLTNGFNQSFFPQLIPFNYTFSETFFGYNGLPVGNTPYDPTLIPPFAETNAYTAYGVNVEAVTFQPDPGVPGQTVTNVPGRIVINADKYLDLTRTILSGPNYLNLVSTNHFVGCTNAQISSPFMDINLGTTNGQMGISNLVAPYIPRLNGPIDMYSARWTNVIAGITNRYHVLFVASDLAPTALPQIINCTLRSTNVTISDVLNVSSSLLINAVNVTITSNAPGAPSAVGQINSLNPDIVWTNSFPVLQNLTNFGLITMSNSVYFLGARQSPYYSSNFTQPYQSFVNHGPIYASGIFVWANYFEDSGSNYLVTNADFTVFTNGPTFFSSFGPINITAGTANISNGTFTAAFGGDIDISAQNLVISNTTLQAFGALSLAITNSLTDMGTNTSNFWTFADGINLSVKPATGDLLGTTITNTAPANREVDNLWAGEDRGASPAGFLNNAALGHLVLVGSNNASTFFFSGPGATNAIYIDLIELQGGATNRAPRFINGQIVPTYTAIDVNPGMTVYFADAIAGGQDISEKLNGNLTESGGQVIWVPGYAGFFSSTNVTYPSGKTYSLNRALVESIDIDSNGNGIDNAFDPAPVFVSEDVNLSVYFTNNPARVAVITWNTLANATNNLFTSTSLTGTNWSLVTNFVINTSGSVSVTNSTPGNGPRYYKVRVDPTQP
jgi:hypothetical protein